MQGPQRRTPSAEYLQFRPYRPIGVSAPAPRTWLESLIAAIKNAALVGAILGILAVVIISISTYFTSNSTSFGAFLQHVEQNLFIPALIIALASLAGGLFTFFRR